MARKHKRNTTAKSSQQPTAAQAAATVIAQRIEDAGTPETLAKARRDVVQHLAVTGKLNDWEIRAANEIERVHAALGASMFPARELDISLRGNGGQFAPVNWLDRMKASDYRIWLDRYLPWCKAMASVRMITSPRVNILAVVVSVVVDNWGLRQCETFHHLRHGEAMRSLKAGLTSYARVAGY